MVILFFEFRVMDDEPSDLTSLRVQKKHTQNAGVKT